MNTLDLTLSLLLVAAALGFLVWQLGLRQRPPACHPSRTQRLRSTVPLGPRASNVRVDDKLARALARAQARARVQK